MKKNSDIFGFIPQLCTLVRSFRSLSLHFAWSTIFSPSQWCLATIVRVTPSWDKMYRKMKMNVKNKLIHDISHVTQRLLIFSGRCNSLLRLQVSKFLSAFQFLLESFIQKLTGVLVFSYCWSLEQLLKKDYFHADLQRLNTSPYTLSIARKSSPNFWLHTLNKQCGWWWLSLR